MSAAAIIAAVTAVAALLTSLLKIFSKSPEEKERARIQKEQERLNQALKDNKDAVEKGASGDTSSIEKRIDG